MSSHSYPPENQSGGGGGSGDVTGPASSGDNAIARFDGATGKIIQSSAATLDDSGNITTPGSTVTGSAGVKSTNLEFLNSSGLLDGGDLDVNGGDNTKFDVAAGSGLIADYSVPATPVYNEVVWGAINAITVTNLGTSDVTYVLINSVGSVIQQTTFPTEQEKRENIFLGLLEHLDNLIVETATTWPDYLPAAVSQVIDLMDALGPFSVDGNTLSANGANLKIDKSVGNVFGSGLNYGNNRKSPNVGLSLAQVAATFTYITQDSLEATGTDLDPGNYDLAGVVAPIGSPGRLATIQRVFLTLQGMKIAYGQTIYDNIDIAKAAITTDPFVLNPALNKRSILIGFIILRADTTDASDETQAEFIPAGKFGTSGSSGSSPQVVSLQGAYNNSATPDITLNATLNGIAIKDASPTIGSIPLWSVTNNDESTAYLVVDTDGFGGNGIDASRALASDANGRVKSTAVTATELGHLSGASSNIQDQLNTNAGNISTNTTNIGTNATGISNNASAITDLQTNLGKVLAPTEILNISTNTTLTNKAAHLVNTASARTLTLPAPAVGLYIPVKDFTGQAQVNNITLATPGSETIDGEASMVMNSNYQSLIIVSDGTNYGVL